MDGSLHACLQSSLSPESASKFTYKLRKKTHQQKNSPPSHEVHSSIDRFLVVFHSPTGMAETGLLACRSGVTVLELIIVPDISRGAARASRLAHESALMTATQSGADRLCVSKNKFRSELDDSVVFARTCLARDLPEACACAQIGIRICEVWRIQRVKELKARL
jgi:hypothetical protein